MEYKVAWTIDIDADSPREAAEQARNIQLDPNSIATHFVVIGEDGKCVEIDLGNDLSTNLSTEGGTA